MPEDTLNILFLGGARRVSLAERFQNAARSLDKQPKIFSYELSEEVPIAALGQIIVGKRWEDPEAARHLSSVIRENGIQVVIPSVDPATLLAAKLKSSVPSTFFSTASSDLSEIFFDKVQAAAWFVRHHVPTPPAESPFPRIAKPRRGSASKGIVLLSNEAEYRRFRETNLLDEYVVQQFIVGAEYTIDAYVSPEAGLLGMVPRLRVETIGGEVVRSRTVDDEEILVLCQEILTTSGLTGPITIQMIRDSGSKGLFVTEINPRLGGGVILSIEAGLDIPAMILRDCLGMENQPVEGYRRNLCMMRAYREFFLPCR